MTRPQIFALWLVSSAAFWIVGFLTGGKVVDHGGDDFDVPNAFGWIENKDEVKRVAEEDEIKSFSGTPAFVESAEIPKSVYLWEAYRDIYGENPPVQNQGSVGSCVGFGASRAHERSLAAQIKNGDAFVFRHVVEEAVYALSRVQVGGGRIRGDGSVGAWAASAFVRFGGLPRGEYLNGKYNLTKYSESLCRSWGNSGLPNDLIPVVREFPVGGSAKVESWAEAKKAMANGYGIFVCSNQGFSRNRDSRGVASPQGRWAHCMVLDGYHTDEMGREYGHFENSWGERFHVGPVGWGSPNTGGFWADASVVSRMLSAGDSWAVSSVSGFPPRRINWGALPIERPLLAVAQFGKEK